MLALKNLIHELTKQTDKVKNRPRLKLVAMLEE